MNRAVNRLGVGRFVLPKLGPTADITLRSRLRRYAGVDVATLDARLGELEREWELERVLEASSAVIGLASLGLSAARGVATSWIPAALFTLLLQHGLQGWSPSMPLLRSLGYRPRKEIDEETYGLKLLRGDFQGVPSLTDAAPETRAYRAWEALKESRETAAPKTVGAPHSRWNLHAPERIPSRRTWISLRKKPEKPVARVAPVVPTDIRAENFIANVRSKWSPEKGEHLDSALRAVLAHLKWRLSPSAAEPMFAHLPKSIARVAEEETPHGFAAGNPPKGTIDADAFLEEITQETGLSRGQAQQATAAIFSSMKRQLPASQNRAMRAMLPKGLKRMWLQA